MLKHPYNVLLAACMATFAASACAQSTTASVPAAANADAAPRPLVSALRPIVDPQRARIGAAITAAERGDFDARADAALLAGILHAGVTTVHAVKDAMRAASIPVRAA